MAHKYEINLIYATVCQSLIALLDSMQKYIYYFQIEREKWCDNLYYYSQRSAAANASRR